MPSLWIYVTSILFHLQVLVCGILNHYRLKRKKSRKRAEASVRHWPVCLPGRSHLTHRVCSSVVSTIFPLYLVLVAEIWSCQCAPHWVPHTEFRVTMDVISSAWAGMVQRGLGRKGAISSLAIITTASSMYFTWLGETLPFRCKSPQRKRAFHIRKRRQSIAFQSGCSHSALVQCDSSYAEREQLSSLGFKCWNTHSSRGRQPHRHILTLIQEWVSEKGQDGKAF